MFDSPPDSSVDPAADPLAARHSRLLAELAEIGMGIARALGRRAAAEVEAAETSGDLALQFTRVARAVRQTLALEARLADAGRMRAVAQAAAHAEQQAEALSRLGVTRGRIMINKSCVADAVEQAIVREAKDGEAAERLAVSLYERLNDDPDDEDFDQRPVSELVAMICADLGLTVDWELWRDEPWAIDEAETDLPGSPYGRPSALAQCFAEPLHPEGP